MAFFAFFWQKHTFCKGTVKFVNSNSEEKTDEERGEKRKQRFLRHIFRAFSAVSRLNT